VARYRAKRFIDLAGDPQTVKQHGELSGYGDHSALFGALASLRRQSKPEAPEIRILSTGPQDTMGALHQEAT
jgi:hypothetical protein